MGNFSKKIKLLSALSMTIVFTLSPISTKADYIDDDCKNHSWYVSDKMDATCSHEGYVEYECKNCFSFYTVKTPINPDAHSWGDWYMIGSVCEDGFYKRYCWNCDKVELIERKAEPHQFTNWKVDEKPTIFTEGYESRYCGICYKEETRKIPKVKAKVSIKSSKKTFKAKKTYQLKLKQSHKEDFDIKWTSSNKKVAKVYWGGELVTKKKGKATITVYMQSGAKATLKITVK